MKKIAWKKALLAAAVLTTLCGTVAFAESIVDTVKPPASVQTRVEGVARAPLAEGQDSLLSLEGERQQLLGQHYEAALAQLPPEQRAQVEAYVKDAKEFREAREARDWNLRLQREQLTWQQREAVKYGRDLNKLSLPRPYKNEWDRLEDMLNEKMRSLRADSREQRRQYLEPTYQRLLAELSSEQRSQVEAIVKEDLKIRQTDREREEALRERREQMTFEQREVIRLGEKRDKAAWPRPPKGKKHRKGPGPAFGPGPGPAFGPGPGPRPLPYMTADQLYQENMAKLSPEQRAQVEAFVKEDAELRERHEEQRDRLQARLEQMTPEQREAVRGARDKERESRPRPPRLPRYLLDD